MKLHVKKGDMVMVRTGKDKGKKGLIIKAFPKTGLVIVEGLNIKKKHKRPQRSGEKGQMIDLAHPISISNVKKSNA